MLTKKKDLYINKVDGIIKINIIKNIWLKSALKIYIMSSLN